MAGGEASTSTHALRPIVVRVNNYNVDAGDAREKDRETRVKIPKVSWDVADKQLYEPVAVSIGPYHCLLDSHELKVGFASTFVRRVASSAEVLYGRVSEVASEARKYYSQGALGGMTDEEFTDVMFVDGCFVLEFIWRAVGVVFMKQLSLQMDLKLRNSVLRDLLLLDNQVPFIVLEALDCSSNADLLLENVVDFLMMYPSLTGVRYGELQIGSNKPIHLLDCVSLCLYDPAGERRTPGITPSGEWLTCPSVTRLEKAGIHCWPTESLRVTDIRFTPKLLTGTAELKIPPVFIREHSMAYWMNLVAYQMYAAPDDETRGNGAAEYVWMLDKLIDDVEDVRKLRAKQIIYHNLESDQKVVALVKNMSQNISRDLLGMAANLPVDNLLLGNDRVLLVEEIQKHLRNNCRRWLHKNVYLPYFRSAWSIPAFLAAVIGLVLTFLQVYYAIYPR